MKNITTLILLLSANLYASSYKIIDDPIEAIAIRLALVEVAEKSIYSSKFIFKDDKMGLSTLATLRQKARAIKNRGLKPDIKLIFDATGSIGIPMEVLLHLEKEGIEIKFFNDIFNGPKVTRNILKGNFNFITDRMHDKLLIVDSKHVVSGGRNIQDSYYGVAIKNYVDRDVYASKEAARSARNHFLEMWSNKALSKARFGYGSVVKCIKYIKDKYKLEIKASDLKFCQYKLSKLGESILDQHQDLMPKEIKSLGIDIKKTITELETLADDKNVEFISDSLDENGRYVARLSRRLIELAYQTKRELLIETPYLIPDKNMLKLFKTLVNRGVKVTVVTNSLKSTDGLQAFAAYSLYRKMLMNLGSGDHQLEIYEYTGSHLGKYLHAKSAVIDGELALIGSYNLDPRSDKHNTEVLFLAKDQKLSLELRDSIKRHITYADPLGRNGKPNGGTISYPGASFTKKAWVQFYRDLLRVPILGKKLEGQL